MFRAVMGPYLGRRLFILSAELVSAGSRLLETLQVDILRFMTPVAGNAILNNYQETAQKMQRTNPWRPTWFEKQMLTIKQEEKEGGSRLVKGRRHQTQNHNRKQKSQRYIIPTCKTQQKYYRVLRPQKIQNALTGWNNVWHRFRNQM
jgi:hypothetical protein